MYIEAWLFWGVIILLTSIFYTVLSSLSSKIKLLQKQKDYEIKALQSNVRRLRKIARHYHPDSENLDIK